MFFFLMATPPASADKADPSASNAYQSGISADYQVTTFLKDGPRAMAKRRIYLVPLQVRLELLLEDGENYAEYQIFDFDRMKMRRLFSAERLYFEFNLTEGNLLKAMLEGWVPWNHSRNIEARKIRLKEEIVNGHLSVLYLQERKREIRTGSRPPFIVKEYSLIWEAPDLENFPVRILNFLSNRRPVYVDYFNITTGGLDPALFEVPDGFLNVTPF